MVSLFSFKEVTLKVPGRTHNRVVKTQIREHEAWKLQQVIKLLLLLLIYKLQISLVIHIYVELVAS